jgi:hypothetical protein
LELSNRYQTLADSSDISVDAEDILEKYKDQNYLNLPKSRIIKSKEIQVGSGAWKRSKILERKKKATEEGKEISRIEKEMSSSSLKHVTNILDLQTIYKKQRQFRRKFRNFYYFNNQSKKSSNCRDTDQKL